MLVLCALLALFCGNIGIILVARSERLFFFHFLIFVNDLLFLLIVPGKLWEHAALVIILSILQSVNDGDKDEAGKVSYILLVFLLSN